jgi:hypothetical protein
MADRFSREHPTKRRQAKSSGAGEQSGESRHDDECADINDFNYDEGDDTSPVADEEGEEDSYPKVDWGPNALKKWRKSKADSGVWLFVKWQSENLAKIMNKTKQ